MYEFKHRTVVNIFLMKSLVYLYYVLFMRKFNWHRG